jgi:hypothetical protein
MAMALETNTFSLKLETTIKSILMKSKYFSFIFIMLFFNCSNTKEDKILNNFKEEKEYRKDVVQGNTKKMNDEDLYILNKTEAINEFEFNKNKRYSYGYKSKINKDSYLLSYSMFYDLSYEQSSILGSCWREYWCIYQIGVGVVSKIKFASNDPILTLPEKKNGVITTISYRPVYVNKETKDGNLIYQGRETIISKYKIENNRFVEIK